MNAQVHRACTESARMPQMGSAVSVKKVTKATYVTVSGRLVVFLDS